MSTTAPLSMSPQALAQEREQAHPPLLLDVRTAGEYAGVHVADSLNMPLQHLQPDQVRERAGDRVVAVLCQGGARARQAQKTLQEAGLAQVVYVEGGIQAWQQAGLPVQRGKGVIPLDRQMQIVVGLLIITGTALGFWLSPYWLIVPGFVGLGLLNAGITGICPLAMVLAIMPWNRGSRTCLTSCSVDNTRESGLEKEA